MQTQRVTDQAIAAAPIVMLGTLVNIYSSKISVRKVSKTSRFFFTEGSDQKLKLKNGANLSAGSVLLCLVKDRCLTRLRPMWSSILILQMRLLLILSVFTIVFRIDHRRFDVI